MNQRAAAVDAYLDALDAGSADPRLGLPDVIFETVLRVTPMINVDLLVRDETGRTLLSWREDAFGRGWHVPGGIIRYRETFAARIAEVARLELRARVKAEPTPCHVLQSLDEPRGHFVSLLFRCSLERPMTAAQGLIGPQAPPSGGDLAWFAGVPDPLYPAHSIYRDWLAG
jgi:colanic acid biosynthesis protein WcaH